MIKKILIIDDSRTCRSILETQIRLINASLTVVAKSNGAEGLEVCNCNDFNLIFVDMEMPNMSGEMFLKELRWFDARTPVVLYSGNTYTIPPEGFIATLNKPFNNGDLRKILESFLK